MAKANLFCKLLGRVVQVVHVINVAQVVQVVQVVRIISVDDMHPENKWFSWSKPSNYQEKLRYYACDGRKNERTHEKWKIEQCSVRPETAKSTIQIFIIIRHFPINKWIQVNVLNLIEK